MIVRKTVVAVCALAGLSGPAWGLSTAELQARIDACAEKGGGFVEVEPGVHDNLGSLFLKPRVILHLQAGAVLKGSRDIADYKVVEKFPALIHIVDAEGAGIVGEGGSVIDGCNSYDENDWEKRGAYGISAIRSDNLRFSGYEFRNCGNFAHWVRCSRNLTFERIRVEGGHDGIHMRGCDDVRITDCVLRTGDDCIAGFDNRNLHVRRCELNTPCQCVRIGGKSILVEDCAFWGPGVHPHRCTLGPDVLRAGLEPAGKGRRETLAAVLYYCQDDDVSRDRGQDIVFRNCRVRNVQRLFHYNFSGSEIWSRGKPLANLSFENVEAKGIGMSLLAMSTNGCPTVLTMKDCTVGFAAKQPEFIRSSKMGCIALTNVVIEGVDGPLVRSWGAAPRLEAEDVRGAAGVEPAAEGDEIDRIGILDFLRDYPWHPLSPGYRDYVSSGRARVKELFVSPEGLSPFDALKRIRASKASGDLSAWTVHVAPGWYEFKEPLVFLPEDSGAPSAPVRWVADGGKAVFAGGGRIAGWRDDGDGTWSAPLPKDAQGRPVWFRSLFVNGRRAVRSRHPDTGFFHVDGIRQVATTNAAGVLSHTQYVTVTNAAADALAGIPPEEIAACELQARVAWSYGAFSIQAWDPGERTLVISSRRDDIASTWHWPGEKNLFCLENVRRGFDSPGEWFYDVREERVRYRPLPGESVSGCEFTAPLSALVSVVRLEGDPASGRAVSDIAFDGISFALSRTDGDELPTGFVQQLPLQAARLAGGCVYARGARCVSFERCKVTQTENYAMRLDIGCVSNRVAGCDLTDLGAGGVMIGDVCPNYYAEPGANARIPYPGRAIPYGSPLAEAFHPCAFIEVSDCTIAHAGRVNPEGCGVLITQASDCSVVHCDIHDLFYTGVSVGWTWGYSGSLAQRNTVAFNRIGDIGKGVMSDMGGIYTLGTSFGTCVSNNVVYGVDSYAYGGWGLYNDEGSEGVVWENNLVYDTKSASYHQHFGRNNIVRNNILACAGKNQLAVTLSERHHSVTFERNIVYWENGKTVFFKEPDGFFEMTPGGYAWDKIDPLKGPFADITWKDNLLWCATGPTVIGQRLTAVVADPLFVDAGARDFRLKDSSPAFALGFRAWDTGLSGRLHQGARESRLDPGFVSGERVVFLGDSITDGGYYISYLQLFDALRHPGSSSVFENAGIGGETAEGGLKRFAWDVAARSPDRVAVMFGMNDLGPGGKGQWTNNLERYEANMRELARQIRKAGAKGTFIRPSPYDEWAKLDGNPANVGYNGQLEKGAMIVSRIAAENGFSVVDFHSPLTDVARRHPGCLTRDRVHPGQPGHLLMAVCAFEDAGESPFVSRIEVSADQMPYRYSPGSLPMPVSENYLQAEKMMPVTERINREILVVHGLPQGQWTLLADGEPLADFTADELSAGVNLALLDTPNQKIAREMERVALKLGKDMSTLRLFARMRGNLKPYGGDLERPDTVGPALEKWFEDVRTRTKGKVGIDKCFYEDFKRLYPTLDTIRHDVELSRRTLHEVRPRAWTIELRRP